MLQAQPERHRGPTGGDPVVLGDSGVLPGDPGRPEEDLVLGAALGTGPAGDAVVDLLEDPRRGGHHGRADDRQVVDDPVDPAVHGHHVTGGDLARDQRLAEHVRHRQPHELDVVGAQQSAGLLGQTLVRPAVVHQTHALGAAGGAGGVDEGGQLLAVECGDGLVDGLGMLRQVLGAQPLELRQGEHGQPGRRGELLGGVEEDDGLQLGQLLQPGDGLGELRRVLREERPGAGVGEDERRLVRVGARIDGGGGRAGAHVAEVGDDPLDPGGGGQRDPVLRADAQRHQARCHGADPDGRLRPGQRAPLLGARCAVRRVLVHRDGETVGLATGRRRHPGEEEVCHGGGTPGDVDTAGVDQGLRGTQRDLRGRVAEGGW